MDKPDYQPFVKMLDSVYALHGKGLTAEAKAMFFRAMSQFPLPMVRAAMDAHVKDPHRGQFPPKPADLIAQISGKNDDGRPGPEEAWGIAVKASDEAETVLMTDEIAHAWSTAKPIMDLGDEVGARMAFKEVYERVCKEANGDVRWWPSLGTDPHKRSAALADAKRAGLLGAPHVAALLPPPMPTKATANPEGLKRLKEEMTKLQMGWERKREEREQANRQTRDAIAAKKRAIADRIDAYRRGAA